MQKNEILQGVVQGLGTDGEGIIKVEGATVFVPFCLVGEKVNFKVLKAKGNVAYGKVESIENKAYSRTNPPCPVFFACGGCDLQHMNYESQLAFKRTSVESSLKKIGGIEAEVSPCVSGGEEFRYRNKLALPIGVDKEGNTVCGFYARHSHRIVPILDCLIQSEWVKDVISAVLGFAKVKHIAGYNEENRTGILRKIVVREIKGKFIFALVVTKIIDVEYLLNLLDKKFENYTFLINVNTSDTNAIFSKEWHICRGFGFFEAEEGSIKYSAGANTFLQVNDGVRYKLYEKVLEEAEENAAVLDLYSGGGMLTAQLAKECGQAYGIEIVTEASHCADELKDKNGLEGKMFNICGAVEENIDKVFSMTEGKKRIIVCDPPRKGMERSVVKKIASSGADKIILISCNPATLARDLGLIMGTLKEDGANLVKCPDPESDYGIKEIIPFDMFPQTKWCETLAVLEKKEKSV